MLLFARHVNDDAFITFRYARNLASGLGPYFNPGEHVEGYTNFLHMLAMAGVFALGGEGAVPVAARALGAAAGLVAVLLAYRIGAALARTCEATAREPALVGGVAAGLVAVFPGFAANATSGLETTLMAAAVAGGVHLAQLAQRDGRWRGAGAAWAAAVLTRPEGIAVFGAHWLASIWAAVPRVGDEPRSEPQVRWKALAADAAVVALALGAQLAFRFLAYDGELLPNTYYAKAEGYVGLDAWQYVRGGALAPFAGVVGVTVGLLGWWWSWAELRRSGFPVLAAGVCGALLPLWTGADWMPGWRFSVPYLPVLAAAIATGWALVAQRALAGRPALAAAGGAALVLGLALAHHGERRALAEHLGARAEAYETGHRALAVWIRDEALRPGDRVALMDIGIVGYIAHEQRILDISGLTDRFIARQPGPLLGKRYDPAYVLEQEPDVVVLVLSGDPDAPLPEPDDVALWTNVEARIFRHAAFAARYRRPREPAPGASWAEALAARAGADRVFDHSHGGRPYLLAAFVRK